MKIIFHRAVVVAGIGCLEFGFLGCAAPIFLLLFLFFVYFIKYLGRHFSVVLLPWFFFF
jgi:hypothetical protein